jgi:putative restriction endonuclease
MRAFLANTDADWYRHLLGLGQQPGGLDEVNFWKPSGRGGTFRALSFGEPLIFKLKKKHGHAVVGFGLFTAYRRLTLGEAWTAFGEANGAPTREAVWQRIGKYADPQAGLNHLIGCILLSTPFFFPQPMWIDGPSDWSDNTVVGKGYDTARGEGRRIWQACLDRAATLSQGVVVEPDQRGHLPLLTDRPAHRYGAERTIRPRLGQSTFRFGLEDAYGRCAVTGEHSLPALDAAHIVPYGEGGPHEIPNGLLLRADVHRLYDRGYVTVTPDYTFKVSPRLREDFDNGKVYYALDGQRIYTPDAPYLRPAPEHLEAASGRFLA